MNKLFSKKKYIFYVVAFLLVLAVFATIYLSTSGVVTTKVDRMVANAQKLYEQGDYENAYYQLQLYCQEKLRDRDAWMLLGDLCSEQGDDELAYTYYKKAAEVTECSEYQLGEYDKIKSFEDFSYVESIKIYPTAKYTKEMTLTFSGENLTPQKSYQGKPAENSAELDGDENYLTTDWFAIDDSKKSVYITGNINFAQWQFVDEDGYYSSYTDQSDFKLIDSVAFSSKSYSTMNIPKGATKARVTYYNKEIDTNAKSDDKIFVGYGNNLTGYTQIVTKSYEIPALEENEYVEYKDGKWTLYKNEKTTNLDWEDLTPTNIATVEIDGELCGTVDFKLKEKVRKEADKNLQYGLKYSTETSIACCERLGAAKGMSFDYMVGDEWSFGTGNDFDTAYPWCEMKLCNVSVDDDGEEKITLEGESGYKTDGSNGNVMVRIPKFYTMRVVQNGYEYIWISGTEHEGYSIEPVFVNSDGSIADYVYIAAYLGAEQDDKIVSIANSYPTLCMEYGTTLEYAENNGDGFSEMNYLMCAALQKLFIVETGTIDSSSIFAGDSYMYYHYEAKSYKKSGYAAKNESNTNTITLYNNYNTIKISEGSSIVLLEGWDSYKNNNGKQREVLKVERNENFIYVTFEGEPVNIFKHKTNISNIPAKTAKTDEISYCSGTLKGELGKVSFKYRNIENLYGSALIMLDDDAYVEDGYFYYYSGGNINVINSPVPIQETELYGYDSANIDMCIKEMVFDENHPQIMIPSVVGDGATTYGYYGDIWMYVGHSKRYLLYGGADDNERTAGIFQMRASLLNYDDSKDFYSARIMYK